MHRQVFSLNFDSIAQTADLSKPQQQFLVRVYSTLLFGVMTLAASCYFGTAYFTIHPILGSVGLLGSTFYMAASADQSPQSATGYYAVAFFIGQTLSPFVEYVNSVDPSILTTAAAFSIALFACLSISSLFATKRSWLFLGAALSTVTSFMLLVSIMNLFFRSPIAHSFLNYGGLVVYLLYVLYDTQRCLEQFDAGRADVHKAAAVFLVDLVQIFIHIARILMEKEKEKKKKDDKRRS